MSKPHSVLHIFNRSPFASSALADALPVVGASDAILLCEDAVLAALAETTGNPHLTEQMGTRRFFVLSADLAARGLLDRPLTARAQIIDYPQWVELACQHRVCQSWF